MAKRNPPVYVTCPCGTVFKTWIAHIKKGGGKHCSRACQYKYRPIVPQRPKQFTKPNPAWAKTAERKGPLHPEWGGDGIKYASLHEWVRKNKTKPDACEFCGATDKKLEWANKSHEYKRDLDDWLALCRSCHRKYDRGEAWGMGVARYGARYESKPLNRDASEEAS